MPKNCGSTALCYTHSADQPGIQQEPEHFERLSLTILGARQEIIYPNREVFCSASRRNDKRIVNCVTVIATQKLDDKDKQVGIFSDRNRLGKRVIIRAVYKSHLAPLTQV